MSAVYPASTITSRSLSSSARFSSVAIASSPYGSPPVYPALCREYASSMNRTPPRAESTSLFVLMAVDPRCSPTRSARCASITSGRTSSPRAAKIRPRIRATVVFPVPGGPVNTKCRAGGCDVSPCRSRSLATRSWAAIARTCCLTGSRPISSSSSASALSRVGVSSYPRSRDVSSPNALDRSGPLIVISSSAVGSPSVPITRTSLACPAFSSRVRMNRPLPSSSVIRRRPTSSSKCRNTGRASGPSASPFPYTCNSASDKSSSGE
jgi:hypothetical protein